MKNKFQTCFLIFGLFVVIQFTKGQQSYTNPVIHADYSDPDVVAVGDTFYMTASSFNCIPGLPLLQSVDLVHWELVGYAIQKLEPADNFSKPQHGGGVWAPSIRYYAKEFYIYYGDPDYGIFLVKSYHIRGPWSKPKLVYEGKGWIDPCPLFDSDGNKYLVHAWAGSRAGIKNVLVLNKLNDRGDSIVDHGVLVFDGNKEHPTVEGPKLYKRNGYYYILAPAGGVKTGWQLALRSKNIYGPYEQKVVLHQGNSSINGPHQGALIEDKLENSWFIHFQDKEAFGRIVHLQPVKWTNDWPEMGIDANNDGIGEPVKEFKNTLPKSNTNKTLPASDEFNAPKIGLQWQWHANPDPTWGYPSSLGFLRLNAVFTKDTITNLWDVPQLFLQKFPSESFTATTKIDISFHEQGDKFGFLIMGENYAYLGTQLTEKGLELVNAECHNAPKGSPEKVNTLAVLKNQTVYLRISITEYAECTFSYSFDNKKFENVSSTFKAVPGRWIGAKIGFFCTANNKTNNSGFVDIDWLRFQ